MAQRLRAHTLQAVVPHRPLIPALGNQAQLFRTLIALAEVTDSVLSTNMVTVNLLVSVVPEDLMLSDLLGCWAFIWYTHLQARQAHTKKSN